MKNKKKNAARLAAFGSLPVLPGRTAKRRTANEFPKTAHPPKSREGFAKRQSKEHGRGPTKETKKKAKTEGGGQDNCEHVNEGPLTESHA